LKGQQLGLFETQLALFETRWDEAAERAKQNRRTIFAQRRLRPDDVLPEWRKSLAAVGGEESVHRFTSRALARLGAGLEPLKRGFKAPTAALPPDVRERLETEGIEGTIPIDFGYPPAPRCRPIQRSHPLVSILAETLLERTLGASVVENNGSDPAILGRVGCWISDGVQSRTTIALLRLRHQLIVRRRRDERGLLVEEAASMAWNESGSFSGPTGEDAFRLLALPPVGDPPPHVRQREAARAVAWLKERENDLKAFLDERAKALLDDHLRVREASKDIGNTTVNPVPPPDVIGVFVLLPRVL
jgi:hypothetical protein